MSLSRPKDATTKCKPKSKRSGKKEGCAALKKKLDNVFSLYIRLRDHGTCISCGTVGEIKAMQCGHYVSRACLPLRFDERNANCQCPRCNLFLHGNLIDYRIALIDKYGLEAVETLESRRHETKKMRPDEYREMIEYYSKRVKMMQGA